MSQELESSKSTSTFVPINLEDEKNTNEEIQTTDEDIIKEVDKVTDLIDKDHSLFETDESESISEEELLKLTIKNKLPQKINFKALKTAEFSSQLGVVQKTKLFKTKSTQLHVAFSVSPSDVYYRTLGLKAQLTHHFSEKWGLSGFGYLMESLERSEVSDFESTQELKLQSLIYLKNYYGISMFYNPIYGKMALFNKTIIDYDIFFNFGLGQVSTRNTNNALGFHGGTGAFFATGKKQGLKVDLNWLFYKTKNSLLKEQDSNSILLSLGYSWFFSGSSNQ